MKWQQTEKDNWLKRQTINRSYKNEVVSKIQSLKNYYDLIQYGALSIDPDKYPLFIIKSKSFSADKKTLLVTGGVHGYETSGVFGALGFLMTGLNVTNFNIVCVPCISPWAYETINRWNPKTIDPNRSFIPNSPAEECELFLNAMDTQKIKPFIHIDLHETTDTDNSVFRPALEKRDDITIEWSEIPDGFYTVGDTENPQKEFQKSVIDSVRKVTHIAQADEKGNIIGEPIQQEGVINYPLKKLSLCTGFSQAVYTTTTEVYPDSPRVTPTICIQAQIAAIKGALNYVSS